MRNALSIILFVFASNAAASTITYETINAANAGRYGKTIDGTGGSCCDPYVNIGAGLTQVDTDWTIQYRNWITFDLTAFASENILEATFEIFNHADNDDSVTFTWHQVTTANSITGVPTHTSGSAIYTDSGIGAVYSSGTAVGDGTTDIYDFSGALVAINAATSMFTIGGSTLDDELSAYDFNAYDFSEGTVQLTLGIETITVVPVPAAAWLFGSGLLALAGFARRKKG